MEVRAGYRLTEVGIIPEQWGVATFREQFRISAGGDVNPRLSSSEQDEVHRFPIYSNALTENGLYGYCSYPDHAADSITITARGSLGVATYRNHKYTAIGRVLVLESNRESAGEFFAEFINSRVKFAVESTGVPQLTAPQIGGYRLAVPPLPEQRAIAAVVSDVDALLDGLDRLIAKKRDLKRAAMQQLLTGQTRLPGFHGEWGETRLGDVASFHKGNGLPKSALSPYGSEPCVHYGELFTQYGETIQETISRTAKSPGAFRSRANDVLMPTSDVTPRGLAKASCVVPADVVLGGDILVIRTDPSLISGTFLSYLIRREENQVLRLVTGTTVFHLYGTDMKKFVFRLPPFGEQQAIVEVLSDMDVELAALETRRGKTRALKQGMMQELLTGRTRLV